ncbi:MAG: hypothetical protein LUQ37_10165 [Methanoregulaceae archaeon]|nr:hypothetical protein [Methanoregulaceae archaeon]
MAQAVGEAIIFRLHELIGCGVQNSATADQQAQPAQGAHGVSWHADLGAVRYA